MEEKHTFCMYSEWKILTLKKIIILKEKLIKQFIFSTKVYTTFFFLSMLHVQHFML